MKHLFVEVFSGKQILPVIPEVAKLRIKMFRESQHQQKNQMALQEFIIPLDIMPFNEEAAFHYGHVRTNLEKNGKPTSPLDMMIAAHALSLNSTLVTNNKKEFSRVPQLKIEDWVH